MKSRLMPVLSVVLFLSLAAGAAEVQMEKVEYAGWPNCVRLTNGEMELVVTTDVGPRVIRFGFVGGQNLFKQYEEQMGKTGGDEWRIYGGHRLWHAPEAKLRTYALDNSPVEYEWNGKTLSISQAVEPETGVRKEISITLAADANHVALSHRLFNENLWDIELSPWTLTVMAREGRAIFPQEEFIPHEEKLLAARPMVLWHYTNMADPRWTWGEKYVQLQQDPNATTKQKVGMLNTKGWAAYALKGDLFVKRYAYVDGAQYPDFGCNTETFTNGDMIEVETLGPMTKLAAGGASVEHVEHWFLFKANVGKDETSIDEVVLPLIKQTDALMR